jgi:hypothetical protein
MQGWICPKCGACYSPFVSACFYCGPGSVTTDATDWRLICEDCQRLTSGDCGKHGVKTIIVPIKSVPC